MFIGYNYPDKRNPGYWGLVVLYPALATATSERIHTAITTAYRP